MYWLLGKPRSILDLRPELYAAPAVQRSDVPICIIDDEVFPYEQLLKDHHFTVTRLSDLSDVREVEAFPLVLCDIRGVGRAFQSKYEGAHVISEIRRFYPHKYIIAYTAQTFDASYNEYFRLADAICKKDIELEEWITKLDEAVRTLANPAFLWKRIRKRLIDMDVSLAEILHLEDQFVGFVRHDIPQFPSKKFSSHLPDNLRPLLEGLGKTVGLFLRNG